MSNNKTTRRTFRQLVDAQIFKSRERYWRTGKMINVDWILSAMKRESPTQNQYDVCRAALIAALGQPLPTPQGERWPLTPYKDGLYDASKVRQPRSSSIIIN